MHMDRWNYDKKAQVRNTKEVNQCRIGKTVSMAEMCPGERGLVIELQAEQMIKERFKALGLEEGTEITCLFSSFHHDPSAFEICGCIIALRKRDRQGVRVMILDKKTEYVQNDDIVCAEEAGGSEVCTVALAGNPNVGKSTLFNALTGLHQHTGNWTGKTVELAIGSRIEGKVHYEFLDLPGTYSLQSHSEEERVAEECLRSDCYDVVVVVCDATCLKRNLLLVLEILEITKKVVLCVNLLDEAEKKSIQVDLRVLSNHLGIPVVGCAARSGRGIQELLEQCLKVKRGEGVPPNRKVLEEKPPKNEEIKQEFVKEGKTNNIEKVLETDNFDGTTIGSQTVKKRMETTKHHYVKADQIVKEAVKYINPEYRNRERKLDKILTSKQTGIPIMLLLLFVIFWLTMKGANRPSEMLSEGFAFLGIKLRMLLAELHAPTFLIGVLMDGIYQVTSFVISVMLPPMAIFFPLFTILEDYGYLPRAAFNLDHTFQKCRACGKQALTMCMGFGCSAAGVTGCRIIDSKRERLVAILTNCLVPCNGKFPTLAAMIAVGMVMTGRESSFFAAIALTGCILLGVFMTFLVSRILSGTLLKGVPSAFTLELPPYRRPQFAKVLVRSFLDRTLFVLGRAAVVAAPAGVLIWIFGKVTLDGVPVILKLAELLNPVGQIFGMDGIILTAFILGFPANEIVIPIMLMLYLSAEQLVDFQQIDQLSAILSGAGWTPITVLCVCVFMLFHWPCSTTVLTTYKETGSIKWTAAGFLIPTAVGLILCAAIHFTAVMIF